MAAPARMNSVKKTPASLVGFPFQGTAAGIFAGVGGAPSARGREVTASATEC